MNKVKVLFDYQIFDTQKVGGISRYFYELISSYEKNKNIDWDLALTYSDNEYLKSLPSSHKNLLQKKVLHNYYDNFFWGLDFKGKRLLYRTKTRFLTEPSTINHSEINKLNSIKKIKEGDFDVFHPTYYDGYFLDYIGDKPFVLTIYDLIHQIFPEFFLQNATDKNEHLLKKAKKIIAISESTKKDLVSIFDVDERKIDVVYLANSLEENSDNVNEDFRKKIPDKYLLFVGGRMEYKNFLFFAQVFCSLRKENKDLYIVCTGSPFSTSEHNFINKLGIQDFVYNTFVNDDELVYLYKNAIAFVFPSMYEGFGLPVLEAFSCGCPALISNSSSLIEIGGDAVIYFEPKSSLSMLEALKQIINNEPLKEDLMYRGYKQLSKFSWTKTANKTKEIYESLL